MTFSIPVPLSGYNDNLARQAAIVDIIGRSRLGPLGPDYQYPMREILGFADGDLQALENTLIDHLTQS